MNRTVLTVVLLCVGIPQTYAQADVRRPIPCHVGNFGEQSAAVQNAMSSFLRRLQTRVAEGRKLQVADLIAYPLNAWINGKNQEVRSKQEFIRLYDQIFTSPLKRQLLEQRPACLSRVGAQGFSFGSGEMWFDLYPDGKVRIFTITPIVYPDEY